MESVKSKLKKMLCALLPNNFISYIEQSYIINHPYYNLQNISFSQEGEDLVLDRYLVGITDGFYIDVGAHHPIRFSNTYKFYMKGWKGINIDAMPGSMQLFNDVRPNDINIEVSISDKKQIIDYYIFEEPAYNTISKSQAEQIINKKFSILVNKIQLESQRLEDVLKEHASEFDKVTFMTIDVEGLDLAVLESNNWDLFRPEYILIETLFTNFKNISENSVYNYLNALNYNLVAKTYNTLLFKSIV